MALSPQSAGPSCRIFFGHASPDAFPPPYGSGSIDLYDADGAPSTAAYTPASLVLRTPDCNYTFGAPALNSYTANPLAKLAPTGPQDGADCAKTPECGRGYWFAATLGGFFALLDTAGPGTQCPAYFARVDSGGDASSGTFSAVAETDGALPSWAPAGCTGRYAGGQTLGFNLTLDTTACSGPYGVDWASLAPGSATLGSFEAGAATVAYESAVSPSCRSQCAEAGYNIAWDSAGEPPPPGPPPPPLSCDLL